MVVCNAQLGDRSLFPDLSARVYLNHAGVSPPSLPVRAAVRAVLDDYARDGAGAFLRWRDQREDLRASLARLIGAAPADIALVPSTSRGVLDVALCFPWRAGDRVVVFAGEFPTNVTPWQAAARTFGLEVVMLATKDFAPSPEPGLDRLRRELRAGVRLVAVSAVQFQSGLRMPLAEMARLCHAHGAELCVDAIQAVGAVPLDARALGVDYLVAGSHKWLMGIDGAGFLYVAPERVAALRPTVAGWLSHEDGTRFLTDGAGHLRYDRAIRARADFLEIGALPTAGCAALGASVALLEGLGTEAIFAHVNAILDALEPGLLGLGFTSLRAPDVAQRSCILGVLPPPGCDLRALGARLAAGGIACATPDGVLRFAPHWPNDVGQVREVLAVTAACLQRAG
jgi:selenocysteine lyase/cysteine desulfurase